MAKPIDAELKDAEALGCKMLSSEPRAAAARYDKSTGRIIVDLVNGCTYAFPVALVQGLQGESSEAIDNVAVDGLGFNLHWPALDLDLYVPALVSGVFGTRDWMKRALAREAGRITSPAKAIAARSNGARGGRPKKSSIG